MKKNLFLATMLLVAGGGALAQGTDSLRIDDSGTNAPAVNSVNGADSLRTIQIDRISVSAYRADDNTPVAFTDIGREQIERVSGSGIDVPFMLTSTPSVVATSDAGTGIGYTSLSIRGTDGTRINVTANGVPLGDPESHRLYWVNVPDFANSVADIQIQRGVGTSTNGAGAFGASVNISTEPLTIKPYGEISGTYGSFNTHRESIRFGTGLIGGGNGGTGRWAFSGRLSNIGSDGYVDRASADLKSYFAQAGFFGRTTTVRLLSFGGREETYHAWNGVTAEQMAGNRRYNSAGEMYATDRFGKPLTDADGNPILEGYYPDQKDFYTQYNVQLIIDQRLAKDWALNVTGHYTRGDGYYEEFKGSRTLSEYGLAPYFVTENEDGTGAPVEVKKSDLVRRKNMGNNFFGAIASVTYSGEKLSAAIGGAWNRYDGDHFGQVAWVKNYAGNGLPLYPEYYRNSTTKNDANIFAKVIWTVARGLSLWGDVQYRHISHRLGGTGDVYDWRDGISAMQTLNVARNFDFFNPKAGIHWAIDEHHSLYTSFAVAHKEPTRNNYTDAREGFSPRSERLMDVELGYELGYEKISAGANLYYMSYKDQLVMTGELNEIGEPLSTNVPKSFRTGAELTFGWQITKWFRWDIFGTFSLNRILAYTDYLYDENYEHDVLTDFRGTTDIAFSPSIVAGNIFSFNVKGFYGALRTNYVGRQYMTNSERRELSLPHYCVTTLLASYRFKLPKMKYLEVGVTVNNLFNTLYSSSGWGSSSVTYETTGTGATPTRHDYAGYFPQATINVLGTVTLSF